jgi:hypothetical protein
LTAPAATALTVPVSWLRADTAIKSPCVAD